MGPLPALASEGRRGGAGDVLLGRVLEPGESVPPTAEEMAAAWLLTYSDRPNTVTTYRAGIRQWFTFCAAAAVDPLEARRPLVDLYKGWMFDQGRAPATVKARLAVLSSFYEYCEDAESVRRSPVRGVRRPKVADQSSSVGLTRAQLSDFLTTSRTFGPQIHALMTVLALNGLRSSEPLDCRLSDLGSSRGHRTLAVTRKGLHGKVRVPLAPMTWRVLGEWMDHRPVVLERARIAGQDVAVPGQVPPPPTTDLVFFKIDDTTRQPVALDRRDVYRWVKAVGAQALPDGPDMHPHVLRHTFVTLSLDAGVSLRDVQDSAGHASPVTTRRYDRDRHNIDRHATHTLVAYLAKTGA